MLLREVLSMPSRSVPQMEKPPTTKHRSIKFLTLRQKLEILADRDAGLTFREIAKKWSLGAASVHGVIKKKEELESLTGAEGKAKSPRSCSLEAP